MTEEMMQEVAAWYASQEPADHLLDEREVWDPAHCRHESLYTEDADPAHGPANLLCEDCGKSWPATPTR